MQKLMIKDSIQVDWHRKALGEDVKSFRETIDNPEVTLSNVPIKVVSKETYDRIVNALKQFTPSVAKFSKQNNFKPFIIKNGKRHLAIDSQGYDYPRYKSPVYDKDGNSMPW